MVLRMRQVEKGLFTARFLVTGMNGAEVGTVEFQGGVGSIEGSFQIRTRAGLETLRPCKKKEAVELAGRRKAGYLHRPYAARGDAGGGVLFHDQDGGFFTASPRSWHFLRLGGHDYRLYHVGFGADGIRAPIYEGSACVAEIRKPCLVIDGLHVFDILLSDGAYVLPAICLACYMYVITYYHAGHLVKSGRTWHEYTTTKRELVDMCDNQFAGVATDSK